MQWFKAGRLMVVLCGVALLPLATPALADAPTIQQLLAEEDQAVVDQLVEWDKHELIVPSELELDGPLREAAA